MTKLTTGERFMRIETKMESMHSDMTEIKTILKDHVKYEEDKFDSLDKKYAPSYTTYFAIGSFLTALGIIITLII